MSSWGKPELPLTPTLGRLAQLMLASPRRWWTPAELRMTLDEPVAQLIATLHQQGLLRTQGYTAHLNGPRSYVAPGTPYGLTALGHLVFIELTDRHQDLSLQQSRKAARFVRDLVHALPEEMADRVLLTGSNVVQVITDSGETYVMTITPR